MRCSLPAKILWTAPSLRRTKLAQHANFVDSDGGVSIYAASQPFCMRFCNGVEENFQHHFIINRGYCITEACITSSIGGHKFVNRQSVNNEANFFINSLIH